MPYFILFFKSGTFRFVFLYCEIFQFVQIRLIWCATMCLIFIQTLVANHPSVRLLQLLCVRAFWSQFRKLKRKRLWRLIIMGHILRILVHYCCEIKWGHMYKVSLFCHIFHFIVVVGCVPHIHRSAVCWFFKVHFKINRTYWSRYDIYSFTSTAMLSLWAFTFVITLYPNTSCFLPCIVY